MSREPGEYGFDVIVIGAGHAGCEAALAAARMGCATALVTLDEGAVARMSCNPAIGGLAKGHLVREIDALGGEMGRAIDATGIQFRLLNRSRGPAVQAPRAQADKEAYAGRMRRAVESTRGLSLLEGEVSDLLIEGGVLRGVVLADGRLLRTACAVVTSGTFLRGLLHVGSNTRPGGRFNEKPADGLARTLTGLGLPMGRLKTGTPPRIQRDSVDPRRMARQPGDAEPVPFSFETEKIVSPQIDCHITYTNPESHRIIRDNLHRSPLYSGAIRSMGPRYCPSIEDKVVRFADRDRHQIFVEPEGLKHPWIYLNGLSTSLPEEVQVALVRTIPGLEEARVVRPGYAVEYDFVQPTACGPTLETRSTRGLFLAGQINGTTGYEEAAALGLIAGINAALAAQRRPPFILSRGEAYIGVLVDDLVLKGTAEPYRMFTSRAEYRLLLDIDSADLRLTGHGRDLGLIDGERFGRFQRRRKRLAVYTQIFDNKTLNPNPTTAARALEILGIELNEPTTPARLMRRGDVSIDALERFLGRAIPRGLRERERQYVASRLRYAGYIERQQRDLARLRRDEARRIPPDLEFRSIPGLSHEVVEKLSDARPESLAQAARISGITPAALSLINIHLERLSRKPAGDGSDGGRARRPRLPRDRPQKPDSGALNAEICRSHRHRRTGSRHTAASEPPPAPPAPRG